MKIHHIFLSLWCFMAATIYSENTWKHKITDTYHHLQKKYVKFAYQHPFLNIFIPYASYLVVKLNRAYYSAEHAHAKSLINSLSSHKDFHALFHNKKAQRRVKHDMFERYLRSKKQLPGVFTDIVILLIGTIASAKVSHQYYALNNMAHSIDRRSIFSGNCTDECKQKYKSIAPFH